MSIGGGAVFPFSCNLHKFFFPFSCNIPLTFLPFSCYSEFARPTRPEQKFTRRSKS